MTSTSAPPTPTATAPLTVVYITSLGHSGSTLLDFLISANSRVVSVGELSELPKQLAARCTCGFDRLHDCPFWLTVQSELLRTHGKVLSQLDINAADSRRFAEDNVALFQAVRAVSGKSVIVDSSKNLRRLKRLLDCDSLHVKPLFLRRKSGGVVYSNVRKGRSWLFYALYGHVTTRSHLEFFADVTHVAVRYEELCRSLVPELRRIMEELQVEFEPDQLRWTEPLRHNIGGNRMRFHSDSTVTLDERWRRELRLYQRVVVALLETEMMLKRLPLPIDPLKRAFSRVWA